jgi:hypothetical protein
MDNTICILALSHGLSSCTSTWPYSTNAWPSSSLPTSRMLCGISAGLIAVFDAQASVTVDTAPCRPSPHPTPRMLAHGSYALLEATYARHGGAWGGSMCDVYWRRHFSTFLTFSRLWCSNRSFIAAPRHNDNTIGVFAKRISRCTISTQHW